uniref:SFRICE_039858 n=1 Tax=Spodoptera frugiperda TaxID=7108 RepID=A0A2H1WQV7_SPOFR
MASVLLEWGCCTKEGINENEQNINCIMCNKSYHILCLTLPEIPSDSEIFSQIALNSPPNSNPVTAEEVRSIVQKVIQVQYATMLQQMNTIIVNTINTELAPVRKDIQELQASLTFHTEEFDKLQSKYKEISDETKCLNNENEHLKNTVSDLNTRINYFE